MLTEAEQIELNRERACIAVYQILMPEHTTRPRSLRAIARVRELEAKVQEVTDGE